MRTLVHISDLHFGRIHAPTLEPLAEAIRDAGPDVVCVSGDLTQRARTAEFLEAREFLDRLPRPQVVVPGNHDVPLHNLYARFLEPLAKYRMIVGPETDPYYEDEEVAVAGVNTARSLTIKDGRVNAGQVVRIEERLRNAHRPGLTKIVVSHHPFDLPEHFRDEDLVGRARQAMVKLASTGVDLFLSGHFHIRHTGETAVRYNIAGHSAVFVQAGTATSTRGRGEVNSWNLIHIDRHQEMTIEPHEWDPVRGQFERCAPHRFVNGDAGWTRAM
jgi:3',5'-cyclic AMP phosphodiesterase CpdA